MTDEHHDILESRGENGMADLMNLDINFPLNFFPQGKSNKTAEEFAEELNQWREKFGAPEITIDNNSDDVYRRLMKRNRRREIITWLMFAIITIFFFSSLTLWKMQ